MSFVTGDVLQGSEAWKSFGDTTVLPAAVSLKTKDVDHTFDGRTVVLLKQNAPGGAVAQSSMSQIQGGAVALNNTAHAPRGRVA